MKLECKTWFCFFKAHVFTHEIIWSHSFWKFYSASCLGHFHVYFFSKSPLSQAILLFLQLIEILIDLIDVFSFFPVENINFLASITHLCLICQTWINPICISLSLFICAMKALPYLASSSFPTSPASPGSYSSLIRDLLHMLLPPLCVFPPSDAWTSLSHVKQNKNTQPPSAHVFLWPLPYLSCRNQPSWDGVL